MATARHVILLTGATGFVGGAIGRAAVAHGHGVRALARSATTAERLASDGLEPVFGDLTDVRSLRRAAEGASVVIHAAFLRGSYRRLDEAIAVEQRATAAFVAACGDAGARFVYTSGIGVLAATGTEPVTEATTGSSPAMRWRRDLERLVLDAGGVVIRPALVYGNGGGEILRSLIAAAVTTGESLYPAPGDKPWPNVQVDDLAAAYLAAVAHPDSTVFNVAAGESTPRAVCEAIGRLIGAPDRTRGVTSDEAVERVPFAGWLAGPGVRVDSSRARATLGWVPTGPGLVADIEFGSYAALVEAKRP